MLCYNNTYLVKKRGKSAVRKNKIWKARTTHIGSRRILDASLVDRQISNVLYSNTV